MDGTLLSCPFCGGEAELVRNSSGSYFVRCANRQCAAKTRLYHENENGARLAWNRREKRTCRNEFDGQYDEATFKCSECGYECELSVPSAPAPYSGATDWDCELPRHCPSCGAMVVSE